MPQKRILPYIILGLLQERPLTGKEITAQFQNEIGEFWKASHSQIYPELMRMQHDNWLKITENDSDGRKKHYQITVTGEQVLSNWIKEPVIELPLNRDLFSLKLFFVTKSDSKVIEKLFNDQIALISAQLEHLKARKKLLFADKAPIEQHFGHYLILNRAIARQEGQLNWLKETLAQLS
ncbi:PadR family transcriptional regulator [Ligilactobacillus animalis]|uniref:PadR family transcriptional regulator n=1 Tax=Ligilactobacillus animalis TaxID=1605 RepID=UPI002647541B|nr:PadR family transcriptional regulator [Ligilactobacillus animalis]WKB74309.1 PadR family transcriptional regulator [Ligilactobacillus animalis]